MTVQDMMIETFREIGGSTTYSPYAVSPQGIATFDFTAAGAQALLARLNRAYIKLAATKQANGVEITFRNFQRFCYLQVALASATVVSQVGRTITISGFSPAFTADGQLNGFWIDIQGAIRVIIASTQAGVLTVDRLFDAGDHTYDGSSASIFGRRFKILPPGYTGWYVPGQVLFYESNFRLLTINGMQLMSNANQNIDPRGRTTRFLESSYVQANPTQYAQLADNLEFNYAPIDQSIFRIDYYSEPEPLTDANQEPIIPHAWHEIIWMEAAKKINSEQGNTEKVQLLSAEIDNEVAKIIQQGEHNLDFTDVQLQLEM